MTRTKPSEKTETRGRKPVYFQEMGSSGALDLSGAVINHDDIPFELTGASGRRIFSKMARNSTIAATLFTVSKLLARTSWRTYPAMPDDKEAQEYAEFFESLRGDMIHSWDHFITNAATCVQYGWSAFEVVLKRRLHGYKNGRLTSKYNDGKIGIKSISFRPQNTLEGWEVDPETGDLLGMIQNTTGAAGGKRVTIPAERLLIFRAAQNGDSPEGRSCLAGAYEDWVYLKVINRAESWGIERELSGLPVMYLPAKLIEDASGENPDPAAVAALNAYQKLVRDVRLNQQSGVILPSDTFRSDDGTISTVPQYQLTLLSNTGQRQIDVNKAAERKQGNIARCILADFLLLGTSGKTGSYALGTTRYDLFATALDGWNEQWAEVMNNCLIPMVAHYNGMNMEKLPKYHAESVKPVDIQTLVDTLMNYTYAGGTILPNSSVDKVVLSKLGIPMQENTESNYAGDMNSPQVYPKTAEDKKREEMQLNPAAAMTGAQGGDTKAGNASASASGKERKQPKSAQTSPANSNIKG